MSEPLEKKLISAFADSWNELAGEVLGGQPTELSLLALREVSGDKMAGALAVAMTWSAGFAAPAAGGLPGVCIALFK
ncbi:MAG: hypothetical protein ACRD68_15120, partial [Pyrinomonadaceae bacterium]